MIGSKEMEAMEIAKITWALCMTMGYQPRRHCFWCPLLTLL